MQMEEGDAGTSGGHKDRIFSRHNRFMREGMKLMEVQDCDMQEGIMTTNNGAIKERWSNVVRRLPGTCMVAWLKVACWKDMGIPQCFCFYGFFLYFWPQRGIEYQ